MAFIADIATAVPMHEISQEEFVAFYISQIKEADQKSLSSKLRFLSRKTQIHTRYSCIPDFKGNAAVLYRPGEMPALDQRMECFRSMALPLAAASIDRLLLKTGVRLNQITHLITVSCTGLYAPGLEFDLADHYCWSSIEKHAVNFQGCYAAIKGMTIARQIAKADPQACIVMVCVELCSLHFYPSVADEDLTANLLFADGAAATLICGDRCGIIEKRPVLKMDEICSAYVRGTGHLMTWIPGPHAFRMHLSREVAGVLQAQGRQYFTDFTKNSPPDYWAIHPGGVKIIDAITEINSLEPGDTAASFDVLRNFGNMSSPTVLFILERLWDRMRAQKNIVGKKVLACAFGPGISLELIAFTGHIHAHENIQDHVVAEPFIYQGAH